MEINTLHQACFKWPETAEYTRDESNSPRIYIFCVRQFMQLSVSPPQSHSIALYVLFNDIPYAGWDGTNYIEKGKRRN